MLQDVLQTLLRGRKGRRATNVDAPQAADLPGE
jgi:hypothetical protein